MNLCFLPRLVKYETSVVNALENSTVDTTNTTLHAFGARPQCHAQTRAQHKFSGMLLCSQAQTIGCQ